MRQYALVAPVIARADYQSEDEFLKVTLWEMTPSILKIS